MREMTQPRRPRGVSSQFSLPRCPGRLVHLVQSKGKTRENFPEEVMPEPNLKDAVTVCRSERGAEHPKEMSRGTEERMIIRIPEIKGVWRDQA